MPYFKNVQEYGTMKDMSPETKGKSAIASLVWRAKIKAFLEAQPRGYVTKMMNDLGCTKSIFYKILDGQVRASAWVPKISRYTGIEVTPEFQDEQTEELFAMFDSLSEEGQDLLMEYTRLLKRRQDSKK